MGGECGFKRELVEIHQYAGVEFLYAFRSISFLPSQASTAKRSDWMSYLCMILRPIFVKSVYITGLLPNEDCLPLPGAEQDPLPSPVGAHWEQALHRAVTTLILLSMIYSKERKSSLTTILGNIEQPLHLRKGASWRYLRSWGGGETWPSSTEPVLRVVENSVFMEVCDNRIADFIQLHFIVQIAIQNYWKRLIYEVLGRHIINSNIPVIEAKLMGRYLQTFTDKYVMRCGSTRVQGQLSGSKRENRVANG